MRIAKLCSLTLGIDVKPHSAWARGPGLEFIVADARFISLHSNNMDSVVAISLLEKYKHKRLEHLEHHRIRAIAPNFSFIYNVDARKIEYLKGSIDDDMVREIVNKFLRI